MGNQSNVSVVIRKDPVTGQLIVDKKATAVRLTIGTGQGKGKPGSVKVKTLAELHPSGSLIAGSSRTMKIAKAAAKKALGRPKAATKKPTIAAGKQASPSIALKVKKGGVTAAKKVGAKKTRTGKSSAKRGAR